jgi:hypothetical protein
LVILNILLNSNALEGAIMKKLIITSCTLILAASMLTSCERSDVGLVAGGVGGAAVGNVLTGGSGLGTAVGAVGGAWAGHALAQ